MTSKSGIIFTHKQSKYKTQYKGPYNITQPRTNRAVTLKIGSATDRVTICHKKPYHTYSFYDVFSIILFLIHIYIYYPFINIAQHPGCNKYDVSI